MGGPFGSVNVSLWKRSTETRQWLEDRKLLNKSGASVCLPFKDILKRHRLERLGIDAHVKLPGEGFQPPVRMTMEIDRFFPHLVPCAKRIVTYDQTITLQSQFRVMLDARPLLRCRGAFRIVISHNKVLVAIQPGEKFVTVTVPPQSEISKVPDFVLRANGLVPIRDQRLIMIYYVGKGTVIYAKDAGVAEVRVGRKEYHLS